MRSREFGEAVRRWRDRVSPGAVGLPAGGHRRAAGLRREEVAQLAGISVDYVTRLEQGRATSPSAQVVEALARALRLSADERAHLLLLAGQPVPDPGSLSAHITPGVHRMLDRLSSTPIAVFDAAWTLITWNPLWAALQGDPSAWHGRDRNLLWQHFGGSESRVVHPAAELDVFRRALVADLRSATARYPADAALRRFIADLCARSGDFAALWDSGAVGAHEAALKTIVHPDVGPIVLDCDVLTVTGSDLRIVAYTAEPGSTAADRLALLAVVGTQDLAGTQPG